MTEEVVIRIAQAHGKSPGQVLLRHMVQLGVAVIPKSSHPDRIKQNIDTYSLIDIHTYRTIICNL
ncbi:NADH-dependent D-xylose reductase-like [Homalodisca vitripennis]|uniref:NADH-dependent D-xylose reductase-like n=1 Tax=Homalodisca vitripennis TaxID=197043 RepID=UPI001EECDB56|nr:NADH-dependent D-xylose reductase-like [Homalodisca vitripennis]